MYKLIDKVYKTAYLTGNPNLAEYIRTAIPVIDNPELPTAATDGYTIYYNPDFLDAINDVDKIIGLYAHEYYHIVYSHATRRGNRDPLLWNLCADVVVNEGVKNRGMSLPDNLIARGEGIFQDLPANITTTTKIYDWLISNSKQMSEAEKEAAEGHEKETEAASKLSQSDSVPLVRKKQTAQIGELGKPAGDNEELREAIGLNQEDTDYIDLIKAMQIECGRLVHRTYKKSYKRPARYEPEGVISKYNLHWQHHPKVDVYIDVSGSMGDNPTSIFQGLREILSKLRIYRPKFFTFDTQIRAVDIKAEKFEIGGGTDIKKVIQKIKSDKADLAILITDCEDDIKKTDFEKNIVIVSDKTQFADYITQNWKTVKENKNARRTY